MHYNSGQPILCTIIQDAQGGMKNPVVLVHNRNLLKTPLAGSLCKMSHLMQSPTAALRVYYSLMRDSIECVCVCVCVCVCACVCVCLGGLINSILSYIAWISNSDRLLTHLHDLRKIT